MELVSTLYYKGTLEQFRAAMRRVMFQHDRLWTTPGGAAVNWGEDTTPQDWSISGSWLVQVIDPNAPDQETFFGLEKPVGSAVIKAYTGPGGGVTIDFWDGYALHPPPSRRGRPLLSSSNGWPANWA